MLIDDKHKLLTAVPTCPYCGSSSTISEECHTTTCAYYIPIYENGVNINPDRNNHTITYHCDNCGETFKLSNKGQSIPTAEEVQLFNLKDKIENLAEVFQEAAKQKAVAEAVQQQQEGIETYRTLFYAFGTS